MTAATKHQRRPHGWGRDVARLLQRDIEARVEMGRKQYGERLLPMNGRDVLADALQESIDQCLYLRQAIEERRVRRWLHVAGLAFVVVVWRLRCER